MDRRTLFSMQAGLLIFLGTVVLLAFRRQRRLRNDRGGFWFGTGYLCAGIGLWLQAERGLLPPVVTILLGNGLFMLFGAFANRAIVESTRQRRGEFHYLLALNALTLVNYAWFTYYRPDVLVRTMEAVVVMAIMYGTIIARCLLANDAVVRPALRTLAAIFAVHTSMSLLRLCEIVHTRQADAWFSWIGIITIAGSALAFLSIDNLRLQDDLQRCAMTDPLTGLLNRRGLDTLAAGALAQVARDNSCCSALMLDLDRFKSINDRFGHATGDACLAAVAGVLRQQLGSAGIAARLGGDEFFVLLPGVEQDELASFTERLADAFLRIRIETGGGEPLTPGVSIGPVALDNRSATLNELLQASDLMLYRQKQMRAPLQQAFPSESRTIPRNKHPQLVQA